MGLGLENAKVKGLKVIPKESAVQDPIDSLKQLLMNAKSSEVKLEILNELVTEAFKSNLNLAKDFASEGVNVATQSNNKKWLPKFYEMKGRMHANLVELDSATYFFDKALKGYKEVNDKKGQATTYFKIGWVHKKKGDLEQALQVDLEALKMMESLGDKEGIAGAYNRVTEDLVRINFKFVN